MVNPFDDGILVLGLNRDFPLQLLFSCESTIFDYGSLEDNPSRVLYAHILRSISETRFSTHGIYRQEQTELLPARVRVRLEWVCVRIFPILPRLECLGIDIISLTICQRVFIHGIILIVKGTNWREHR